MAHHVRATLSGVRHELLLEHPNGDRSVVLHAADGSSSLVSYLPADHSTEWGHHVLNRAIDVQVAARGYISVALILASGGQALDGACTAHGTLETLQ